MAKMRALGIVLCVAMLLSGCAPFSYQSVNDLLQAPALGPAEREIQRALRTHLEEDPQYKYPKEGEWRSPIVMVDLNGDGQQECVLFYSQTNKTQTNDVYVALLEQSNGEWGVTQEVKGLATDVASVEVANMFGDGTRQLVVGYVTSNYAIKTMAFYQFDGETLRAQSPGHYTHYLLGDIAGGGRQEIALVSELEEEGGGLKLDFMAGVNGVLEYTQKSVALLANFVSCVGLYPSAGEQGERVLIVDGKTPADLLASQVLYYSGSGEGFYARPGAAEQAVLTARYSPLLTARDIDGDGVVEIPTDTLEYISTESGALKLKIVEWSRHTSEAPTVAARGILDADRNVFISLPLEWGRDFIVTDGTTEGEWQLRNLRTGEVMLELRARVVGEPQPSEERHVPGTANQYVFSINTLSAQEKQQIKVITLV